MPAGLVRARFRLLTAHCVLTWRKGQGSPQGPFHKALTPPWGLLLHEPTTSQRPTPPSTITLGVRIATYDSWGDTNVQTKHISLRALDNHCGLLNKERENYLSPLSATITLGCLIQSFSIPQNKLSNTSQVCKEQHHTAGTLSPCPSAWNISVAIDLLSYGLAKTRGSSSLRQKLILFERGI